VPSTVIRHFSYEPAEAVLTVTFVSGERYAYDGVPEELYESWRAAFSKGQFFAARVRGRFPYRRLGRGDEPSATPAPDPRRPSPSGPASPPRAAGARSAV
jgi:hypothetical protein